MFTVEEGFVKYCNVLKNMKAHTLEAFKNREQIFEHFDSKHKKLELLNRCRACLFRIRNECNGMCFKGLLK